MRFFFALFLGLTAPIPAVAQEPMVPEAAESLREQYEADVSKLESAADEESVEAVTKYAKQLDDLITSRQAQGDLDAVLLLKQEREKVAKGDLSKSDKPAATVAKLRSGFDAALRKAVTSFDSRSKGLHTRFLDGLTTLEKAETKAGRLESAVALRNYRQAVAKTGPVKRGADPITPQSGKIAYYWRFGAEKERLLTEGGGTKESELAVHRALTWLSTKQNANGSWGVRDGDEGVTEEVILAFLGAGHTHAKGRFKITVQRGIQYLIANYGQPSTNARSGLQAFCELYGMTGDPRFKSVADNAFAKRNKQTTFLDCDAVRAAKLAGVAVPASDLEFLKEHTNRDDPSREREAVLLSVVRSLNKAILEESPTVQSLRDAASSLSKESPVVERLSGVPETIWFRYRANELFYCVGGKEWSDRWNPAARDSLMKLQIPAGQPYAGAFIDSDRLKDPKFTDSVFFDTARAVLMLEVYYRYPPEALDGTL